MEPQFKDKDSFRDGSMVEVQVRYEQGMAGKMDEKNALKRAIEIIERRLGDLEAPA